MEILLWILVCLFVNAVIGAMVCASLDTEDQVVYNWYKQDPTGGIAAVLILELWPVMAVLMWRYRQRLKQESQEGS